MARVLKEGLDYFPFDVDFFSDKKIKRLRARFGTDGIAVYIYLLCEIYRSGYYIDYDEDLILDISDELNISENLTTQIMNYLLSRSLLNDKLAKSVKVLTAASVQLQYQESVRERARKRHKDIEVDGRLWVLEKNETESYIKVRPEKIVPRKNDNNSTENEINSAEKSTKESKEK